MLGWAKRIGSLSSSMGKSQRTKGHAFERAIAARLRGVYPHSRRGLQSRDGSNAPDVDGTPWWIECKKGKAPSAYGAIAQADAATDGRPVIAVLSRDPCAQGDELVVMRWTTFIDLLGVVK